MKQRAQHIAVVLAFAPVIYVLERVISGLSGNNHPPNEPFRKFLWDSMWEDLSD